MSWLRNSPLRQSLSRNTSQPRPGSDCDPKACFDSFCRHWHQSSEIISKSTEVSSLLLEKFINKYIFYVKSLSEKKCIGFSFSHSFSPIPNFKCVGTWMKWKSDIVCRFSGVIYIYTTSTHYVWINLRSLNAIFSLQWAELCSIDYVMNVGWAFCHYFPISGNSRLPPRSSHRHATWNLIFSPYS